MTIVTLLEGLKVIRKSGTLDADIKGIAYDSRLVKKDFLFVAVRGYSVDGHDFIEDAVSRGATAVVMESAVGRTGAKQQTGQNETTFIEVPDTREALAHISSAFYGHPSRSLTLIGITGTNGKTTTSFITKNIMEAGNEKAGLLGTIYYMTGDKTTNAFNTTPESLDLQRYLQEMVNNNMKYAVLEVSSHALALRRIDGCSFKVGAYTNFSQDHLDFHGTMDAYFKAKGKLFDYLDTGGMAVLNWDDPMIRPLSQQLHCDVITCGLEEGAMIKAENVKNYGIRNSEFRGLSFDVRTPVSTFRVHSKLIGRFNVYNILISIGIAYALGIDEQTIRQGIKDVKPVDGRFENIDEGQNFLCIVDYAHTEDALRTLLQEARRIAKGRVITVFGCGGDRDRTKRPLMGAVATDLSDFVVVTSDNPRSENPSEIIRDIVKGIKKNNYTSRPDREEAIMEAVFMTREGDTLLIAGKGHENYQEVNGVRHHFSDTETARNAIRKRLAMSGSWYSD